MALGHLSAHGELGPVGITNYYYALQVNAELTNLRPIVWKSTGETNPETVKSDTLWVGSTGAVLKVGRNGVPDGIGGPCEAAGGAIESHGFYALSGAQTVTVETIEYPEDLNATVSRSPVHRGDTVTVRATDGHGALVSGVSWGWEPDSGAAADTTRACTANPCTTRVWGSGAMPAYKDIGTPPYYSKHRSARAHVVVYTSFTLAADTREIPAGDTVTFTPTLDGKAGGAARWAWVSDSGARVDVSCGAATCRYAPAQSGTMWAYTAAGAGGDSASQHVDAIPCPTGDSLLDNMTVRNALTASLNEARADSSISRRIERGWYAFDSAGTQVFRLSPGDPADTPCGTQMFRRCRIRVHLPWAGISIRSASGIHSRTPARISERGGARCSTTGDTEG